MAVAVDLVLVLWVVGCGLWVVDTEDVLVLSFFLIYGKRKVKLTNTIVIVIV